MAKQVQIRRGTTSQTSTFTGAAGEITVDTDKNTVVVHNGSTAGGFPLATQSDLNGVSSNAFIAASTKATSSIFGIVRVDGTSLVTVTKIGRAHV